MKLSYIFNKIKELETSALVVFQFEEEKLQDEVRRLDELLAGNMTELLKDKDFIGKLHEISLLYTHGKIGAKRVILAGLGKRKEFGLEKLRETVALVVLQAREIKLEDITLFLPSIKSQKFNLTDLAQAMTESAILSLYQFHQYKKYSLKDEKVTKLKEIFFWLPQKNLIKKVQKGAETGKIIAQAVNLARDLANHPSGFITPTQFAKEAQKVAQESGLKCKVLDQEEIKKLKMGAFLGVARGSDEEPKFIILEYQGRRKVRPIVLAGKGITFDAGGISLKTPERMDQMKMDMTGAASVLASFQAASQLKLPVNLVGLIPATENLPSGKALKPGDILETSSGKTIEVITTDAEGRMILADALIYAQRFKPQLIIDLATLTSAIGVALGDGGIGVLGNDQRVINKIKSASARCGERVWQFPLWEDYKEKIKSEVADIKNVGEKGGDVILSSLFLKEFVDDFPWIHLDIAAVDYADKQKFYQPKGATGAGVKLLIEFLRNWNK